MNELKDTREGRVATPNEFFAKSKLEYSDWRWAFYRELIQNSYDAGASRIDFEIGFIENRGTIYITCTDNGCGMSEEILLRYLLSLGGSHKPQGGIGGFGYAKSLLFFAHVSYRIRTQDQLVEGNGGSYIISQCRETVRGTTVTVEMAIENGYMVEHWISILKRYASFLMLQRPCSISCNNAELKNQFEDFEYSVPTSLGMFSFKETNVGESRVVVAVRGLPMFVQRVYSSGSQGFTGLLELEGDSRELLTSNRDALKGMYANHLSQLIQKMVDERHVFKRGTTLDITLNYTAPLILDPEQREFNGRVDSNGLAIVSGKYETLEDELRYMTNEVFPRNFNLRIQNTVGRGGKDKPEDSISVATVLGTLRKGWVQSLAICWKTAVYSTLFTEFGHAAGCRFIYDDGRVVEYDKSVDLADLDFEKGAFYRHDRRISVGFIFAKGTEGLNVKPNDGSSDILILCNPQCFNKAFLVGDLLDLAIHENSHLLVSGHNEEFVDVDMKFRRSFRRVMNEQELKVLAKCAIAAKRE